MNTPLTRAFSLPILLLGLSLATSTQPVLSQEQPALPSALSRVNDFQWRDSDRPAQHLITQPLTIEILFADDPSAQMVQVVETIPSASSRVAQPLNPFDALKDPSATLKRFLEQEPPAPPPLEPLEFFKLPGLDSGLTLKVLDF